MNFNYKILSVFLIFSFLLALTVVFLLWLKINSFEPDVYYYVPSNRSFIYSDKEIKEYGFEDYVKEKITTKKKELLKQKASFIDLNLEVMEITLYKEGEIFEKFPIKSKGKEGSWWQTPPGFYLAGDKVVKHFSSTGRVWMPYGVQFYGNFFIHGWPYTTAGVPLSMGSSGGCIRLDTDNAKTVYEFAERSMPILVFEKKLTTILSALVPTKEEIIPLNVTAEAFLVADLDTGEIILDKEIDSEVYAGPIVQGMMALVGSEVVNLEKRIIAKSWMIEDINENIIIPGKSYRGNDLLYPLLKQSSREAALVLSRFLTTERFVSLMNDKARAIGMENTIFVDVTGILKENITTLYDVAKMMRYIKDYRGFILEISNHLAGIGDREGISFFAVEKFKKDNENRNILIAIVNSNNYQKEFDDIMIWLKDNFELN